MSTIRIDEKHQKLLDKLIANMILRGRKINKKKIIGELIENALISEGIPIDDELIPLEEDPAWIGLNDIFHLGFPDLSENVDNLLYQFDGED
ncbi:MAG: hypothetical protein ACTSWX_00890 [Promethearchaeota archaeon]